MQYAMAPSFLLLPPELRVQIYRRLLCHSSLIQLEKCIISMDWINTNTDNKTLSGSESKAGGHLPLGSAILRTCRTIYSEAMPVLYGENTFHCLYGTPKPDYDDCRIIRFPDMKLKHMKHLLLVVDLGHSFEDIAVEGLADTARYFIKCGVDLRTFELSLHEVQLIIRGHVGRDSLFTSIAASQAFLAVLVALHVSETLTISVWYTAWHHEEDDVFDHELQNPTADEVQNFANRLACEKKMTATKQEPKAAFDGEDGDGHFTVYKLSWCLRPVLPE